MTFHQETPREGTTPHVHQTDSPAMLQAILKSASQAILTVGDDGRILSANPKCEEMFGYAADELVGRAVETLLPEQLRAKHTEHRTNYKTNPHSRPNGLGIELTALRQNGDEFPVEVSLSYVRLEHGLVGIAFISDITERKRLEAQLLQSQKMEAVGRLAGGIAHDFNNLLTIIAGYDRLLIESMGPDDPGHCYAEEILKAADRAAALTKQLLTFSRRQLVQPRHVNLNDILADAQKMLGRLIGEHIELVVVPGLNLGTVRADPGHIEQVIFNLVANGRDAVADTGGRIVLETANVELGDAYTHTHFGVLPGRYVMLAVTDNGKGMDAETRRHVFEPFFTTKLPHQGTGLGLATVYGIVKQNNGEIWVYSEPGRGTTVKIYLPLVPGAAEKLQSAGDDERSHGGSETILVVEDDPGVRQLVVDLLEEHGYTVVAAADGIQALETAGGYPAPIDLLLTDVVMPHMNGSHLAKEMKRLYPDVKVVFMSGYTEHTIGHQGVLDESIHFVQKPFQFHGLLRKLREALARS